MNILIHDLSNEQFQSLFPEANNDVYIISDTGTIRHCIGTVDDIIEIIG